MPHFISHMAMKFPVFLSSGNYNFKTCGGDALVEVFYFSLTEDNMDVLIG